MNTKAPNSNKSTFIPPPVAKRLILAIVAYYLIYAMIFTVFGKDVASWLATPLWGVPIFIIARWDRIQTYQPDTSWKELFRLPRINYLVIIFTLVAVIVYQFLFMFLFVMYVDRISPHFGESSADPSELALLEELTEQWQLFLPIMIFGYSTYFVGGYFAGKLSEHIRSAYNNAITASFVFLLANLIYMLAIFSEAGELKDAPIVEIVGTVSMVLLPAISIAMLGARLALRKRFPIRWLSKKHLANKKSVNLSSSDATQPPQLTEVSAAGLASRTNLPVKKGRKKSQRHSKNSLKKGHGRLTGGSGQLPVEATSPKSPK